MRPEPPHAEDVGAGRRTLRDLAVGMVWIAGFLGAIQASDGVSMVISLSLMTFSAMFLAYRGKLRKSESGKRARMSLPGLLRVAAWVILGPLIVAFAKLQVVVGFDRWTGDYLVLPILALVLLAADRLLAGKSAPKRAAGTYRDGKAS